MITVAEPPCMKRKHGGSFEKLFFYSKAIPTFFQSFGPNKKIFRIRLLIFVPDKKSG